MKYPVLYIVLAALCLLTISWAIPFQDIKEVNEPERVKIALREVGNQLLLHNQDSTSLVLPIKQTSPDIFELKFESTLTFLPDSLVAIMDRNFTKARVSKDYIVQVLNCEDQEVSYSYEMNMNWDKTIIPCSGRQVPDSCHRIEVTFINSESSLSATKISMATMALIFLVFGGYRFRESVKKTMHTSVKAEYQALGMLHFYSTQNKLVYKDEEIALSKKECELLDLFITRPNTVITREELTKSVWEDHGVIVSRSLDTYISKLRKKLKVDPELKITNVHGVGYRLEMN